jgi:hypothetical protein
MAIFMIVANIDKPFINAILPSIGFLISTLTIARIKTWWLKKQ